jgi:hypothetical protein
MVGDNYRSSFDTAGMRWGFPPCHRHRLCPNTVGAHASCLLLHISAEMQRPTRLGERAKKTQAKALSGLGKLCMAATTRHPERWCRGTHTHHNGPPFLLPVPHTGALATAPSAQHRLRRNHHRRRLRPRPAHPCSPAAEYLSPDGRAANPGRGFMGTPSCSRLPLPAIVAPPNVPTLGLANAVAYSAIHNHDTGSPVESTLTPALADPACLLVRAAI